MCWNPESKCLLLLPVSSEVSLFVVKRENTVSNASVGILSLHCFRAWSGTAPVSEGVYLIKQNVPLYEVVVGVSFRARGSVPTCKCVDRVMLSTNLPCWCLCFMLFPGSPLLRLKCCIFSSTVSLLCRWGESQVLKPFWSEHFEFFDSIFQQPRRRWIGFRAESQKSWPF